MNTSNDTREELRPYRNRKLGFEGVLIHVIQPNAQNNRNYELVFGSVYAQHEKIELDHVVIRVNKYVYQAADVELFQRYRFTAYIESYKKVKIIEGISAQTDNYMLVRPHKIDVKDISNLQQPTRFVKNRIEQIVKCNTSDILHTEAELYEMIASLKNNGDVEELLENYIRTHVHKKITRHDIINTIYTASFRRRPKAVS